MPSQNAMLTDETDEWVSDEEISDLTTAKIIGIKICRNRCLVHADSETALANALPVLTMLLNILAHGGSMNENISNEYVSKFQSVSTKENPGRRLNRGYA